MDEYTLHQAAILQQIAATRHKWTVTDRADYENEMRRRNRKLMDFNLTLFKEWSAERMIYAIHAMAAMGITEEDQYYA